MQWSPLDPIRQFLGSNAPNRDLLVVEAPPRTLGEINQVIGKLADRRGAISIGHQMEGDLSQDRSVKCRHALISVCRRRHPTPALESPCECTVLREAQQERDLRN